MCEPCRPTYICFFEFVGEDGKVIERFIGFEPLHNLIGIRLAECVVKMVRDLSLDLSNCWRQSFDNASNMSGKYNGLQAYLNKENPVVHYSFTDKRETVIILWDRVLSRFKATSVNYKNVTWI